MAFLEGERPSKRRSSRSSVALSPLFPTGGSTRGEGPVEGGVRGTRTGRPCNSEIGEAGLGSEAIEPVEDPEGPNSSLVRIGS